MTYERKFGRHLERELTAGRLSGELFLGQWISWEGDWQEWNGSCFSRRSGRAFAQPDAYIVLPELVLLFECKLTQTEEADAQLVHLYRPLLTHIYSRPVVAVQVCKALRHAIGAHEIHHPRELLQYPRPDVHTWHWLAQ